MSSSILYKADGTGAVARALAAKIGETISVDDFGAVGDYSLDTFTGTDDYAAIKSAQNALLAMGGGELLFTHGKRYATSQPIPMASGVTYKGTGSSGIDLVNTTSGAQIVPTGTAAFTNAATTVAAVKFENLSIYSPVGGTGGHIFDWLLAGEIAKVEFDGCIF